MRKVCKKANLRELKKIAKKVINALTWSRAKERMEGAVVVSGVRIAWVLVEIS